MSVVAYPALNIDISLFTGDCEEVSVLERRASFLVDHDTVAVCGV